MALLMVSICSSFVVLGSALTPEETVAKIDTMFSFSNLYKPKEIQFFKKYVLETQRKYFDELEISARLGYFKDHLRLKADSESQYCARSDFSDRSRAEILQRTGYVPLRNISERIAADAPYIEAMLRNFKEPLPESFDWREKNVLDKVRNQGSCGSCWAFAFIAMIEAQVAKHTKKPVSLSKSQLVECDENNHACFGGNEDRAWIYITQYGYETEEDYPYRNGDSDRGECNYDEKKSFLYIKEVFPYKRKNMSNTVGISKPVYLGGSMKHFNGSENIKRMLVNHGPVTASMKSFYLTPDYHYDFSKVLHIDPYCCSLQYTDHLVVIVGYGVENGTDYWIMRNSWGETWGDKGYAKLARGINICAIEEEASIVTTSLVKN